MGQEYFINDQNLEDRVRELLPSQGGAGAGIDLSASTQIIPIIDLTESASGSNIRQDIQTAISYDSATTFDVEATSTTIINNTGYYRIAGTTSGASYDGLEFTGFRMTDGTSNKDIFKFYYRNTAAGTTGQVLNSIFDFNIFLPAGYSINALSTATGLYISGSSRQIATIDGTLVNPN